MWVSLESSLMRAPWAEETAECSGNCKEEPLTNDKCVGKGGVQAAERHIKEFRSLSTGSGDLYN